MTMPPETSKVGSTEVIDQVSVFSPSHMLPNEAADKLLRCNFCASQSAEILDGE